MKKNTLLLVLKLTVTLAFMLGVPPAAWFWAKGHASRVDYSGPLTWGFAASSLPCALTMYFMTRRYRHTHQRGLAACVCLATLLSTGIAVLISGLTGVLVSLQFVNFPFVGASLGWQLGGAFIPVATSDVDATPDTPVG